MCLEGRWWWSDRSPFKSWPDKSVEGVVVPEMEAVESKVVVEVRNDDGRRVFFNTAINNGRLN